MKFIGFLVFMIVFLMGFSMLLFLGLFVGYWLTLIGLEAINPKLAHAIIGYQEEEATEE
jgi:F0F1-type ATP synthase assembly protein I